MQKEFPPDTTIELTEREREILKLLATGLSNKEIAHDLVISSNTVKVHLRNIFAKIGVASRTEAAMYAVHNGWVTSIPNLALSEGASALNGDEINKTRKNKTIIRTTVILAALAALILITALLIRPLANPNLNPPQSTATSLPRWKILSNLPTSRTGLAIETFENKVYAIGGESTEGVTGLVERYDPTNNLWVESAPKPLPVADIHAAAIGGRIFIPGGRQSSGTMTNALEIYNPQLDQWENGKDLPIAMSAYAMAAFEGRLYLFGGWDGKNYLNSVLIYDPSQDEWSVSAPMPYACGFAGAAIIGENIYLVGGYDGKHALNSNEVYAPYAEEPESRWSESKQMPEALYDFGIISAANSIFIVGGKNDRDITPAPLVFTPGVDRWQVFETPPVDLGEDVRLASLGQFLYAIGGRAETKANGYTLSYQAFYTVLFPSLP